MKLEKCIKESFIVIGKEGSTNDGTGFIEELWKNANSNFIEVAHMSKKDDNGNLLGVWGAMSDFSRSFDPWQNGFSQGHILQALNVTMMQSLQKVGQSGLYRHTNICMSKMRTAIPSPMV